MVTSCLSIGCIPVDFTVSEFIYSINVRRLSAEVPGVSDHTLE